MSRGAGLERLTASLQQALPALRALAVALTGDRGTADALLARVVERVVTAWPRYARSADPVDAVRELLVREAVREAVHGAPPDELPDELPDQLGGVPRDAADLVRALAGMPVEQRAVLVLRDLCGASAQRTAAVLRLPPERVAALHRTAVLALGRALGEELEDPAGPQGADRPHGASHHRAPRDGASRDGDGNRGASRDGDRARGAEDVVVLDLDGAP